MEHEKYSNEADKYLESPAKIEGLLKKAINKANRKKGTLGGSFEKLQLLFELIKAYLKGDYRSISTSTIISVIAAILYFVSPIDLIPDFLVGIGIFDDAAVLGFTFKKINKELEQFSEWKYAHNR